MKNDEEIVKLADKASECPEAVPGEKVEKIDKLCLAKCFFGVLTCYIVYALCHESITRQVSFSVLWRIMT